MSRAAAALLGSLLALLIAPAPYVAADSPLNEAVEEHQAAAMEEALLLAQAGESVEKESPAEARQARQLTADEIVQAIKLRAQRELAKRRAKKWSLDNLFSWTFGNESNPALLKGHISAKYMEEYFSTTFSYRFNPKLTWQLGYSLDALNYDEYTDGSTLTNSVTTKLIYRPVKPLRLEAHYTYDDSDYPYDDGASTWDQKVHLRLRHSFLKKYYHYLGWTYLYKQYTDKLKRESTSTRIPTKYRKDRRHTGMYEIGGRFGEKDTLKLKQDFYFNDSNEGHQDYNDAQDYKVRATWLHDWAEKWSSSSSFTYELKRYERRNVTTKAPEAQQDYTKTYETGITYKFTKDIDATYTWKYKQNDSNDPAQSYQDITNSIAVTVAF